MDLLVLISGFIVLIFSVIIHEVAHGSVAFSLGDQTAKVNGRLTLNPLNHIDPIGTILLPGLLFLINSPTVVGWAKPVPVNFNNITDKRWGALKVSLAGPAANFIIALIFALIIRFIPTLGTEIYYIFQLVVIYNLVLGIFNLIPIPPLDGSHVLFDLLPQGRILERIKDFLNRFGFIILVFAIFIYPGIDWIFTLVGKIFLFVTGQPIVF
jgi:Zn-dependent protease